MSDLCDPMDCSTPGFTVLHYLPAQACVHWVGDPIQPFQPLSPTFSPSLIPFPGSFPMSLASGSQSIGASALESVLPGNIQNWIPLGLKVKVAQSCLIGV